MEESGSTLRIACVSAELPGQVIADLSTEFSVDVFPITQHFEALRTHDVLVITSDVPVDRERLADLPVQVRAIATYSAGLDHIDVAAVSDRGLALFNTPGALADSVAEIGMFLLIGAARRATESIDLIRSGQWRGWSPTQLLGAELSGRTLGVLGMGEIGRALAKRAAAFGMRIAYHNRRRLPTEDEGGARYWTEPDEMLAACDALALCAPSTEQTRGFLNSDRIRRAKTGMIVINTGRGDLVVDNDLIEGLITGQIGAAGLDTLAGEPAFDPRYLELPNVFLLPHIGSSTIEARRRMGAVLIKAIKAWEAGVRPANQVV